MNFENIVISPPDNYRFINFVPSVYIYILSDIGKSKNRLEVSFKNISDHFNYNSKLLKGP